MRKKKIEAIARFGEVKVLVLGDVMLDLYDLCNRERSKPIDSEKPGKRAYTAHQSVQALGGAGNVAMNLASLGVSTCLVGITGDDGHLYTLQRLAEAFSIKHRLVVDANRPTTVKTRIYIDGEYLLRKDYESEKKIDGVFVQKVLDAFKEAFQEGYDALILSDYNKGIFTEELVEQVIALAREKSVPIIVDIKPSHKSLFAGADIIAPNQPEAEEMVPFFGSGENEEGVKMLYEELGCRNLIVTLGEKGICGYDGSALIRIPGNKVKAVDAVGCGDTVRAVLALGYTLGLSLEESASLANDAAAVIVQKKATAHLSCEELETFIKQTDTYSVS